MGFVYGMRKPSKIPSSRFTQRFLKASQYVGLFNIYWTLTFSAIIMLVVTPLLRDGMFMDGMLYTSVAHNYSQGIGTFWNLSFKKDLYNDMYGFYEQPPLGIAILSWFFNVFGSSMYVERVYVLLLFCITVFQIKNLWRMVLKRLNKEQFKSFDWLVILIWVTVPVVFWSYQSNMLENTMSVFTFGAIICFYKIFTPDKVNYPVLTLASFLIFCAVLTKGIPGLFPLSAPIIYWCCTRNISFKNALIMTVYSSIFLCLVFGCMYLIPQIQESLFDKYMVHRLIHRIKNDPTVLNQWYIIREFFMESLVPILSTIIVLMVGYFSKGMKVKKPIIAEAFFLIVLSFAGTFPLALTKVQRTFYCLQAIPFFHIGLCLLFIPMIAEGLTNVNRYKWQLHYFFGTILLLSFCYLCMFVRQPKRDLEMLHDVYAIGDTLHRNANVVYIDEGFYNEWGLQCYLMRNFNINLTNEREGKYFIFYKKNTADIDLTQFTKININTYLYDIYCRKKLVANATNKVK